MKKIYFYQAYIEEVEYTKDTEYTDILNSNELRKEIHNMLNNKKYIEIIDKSPKIILEVRKIGKYINKEHINTNITDAEYVYATIGKEKDHIDIGIRDNDTKELKDIPLGRSENLEIFTHFYLFLETGIIVFLSTQYAPRIHFVSKLYEDYCMDNLIKNRRLSIKPVLNKEVIATIKNKNIITKVEVDVEVVAPNSKTLGHGGLSLPEKDFEQLSLNPNMTLKQKTTYTIGNKKETLFNPKKIVNFLQGFIESDKIVVSAKDKYSESAQEYDLAESRIIKKVNFKHFKGPKEHREKEIESKLLETYYEEKDEVLKFIQDITT